MESKEIRLCVGQCALAAPPEIVIKVVAWHRGGATIGGKPGQPWPWGEATKSPYRLRVIYDDGSRSITRLMRFFWVDVVWCADLRDLEPPTGGER